MEALGKKQEKRNVTKSLTQKTGYDVFIKKKTPNIKVAQPESEPKRSRSQAFLGAEAAAEILEPKSNWSWFQRWSRSRIIFYFVQRSRSRVFGAQEPKLKSYCSLGRIFEKGKALRPCIMTLKMPHIFSKSSPSRSGLLCRPLERQDAHPCRVRFPE